MNHASISGSSPTLPSLTSLRFFAALCVLFHHVGDLANNLPLINFLQRTGWLGVSFFFILSGFVLMWSFDQSVGRIIYILRRLTRIYPLHFATLVISLTLFLHTGITFGGYIGTPWGTLANFLLIHDWLPGHPDIRQAWNGVSWTLSCEFFFYLLAPFILPFFVRIGRLQYLSWVITSWLALMFIASLAQQKHWGTLLDFYIFHPLPCAGEFFLGALGAQWVKAGLRFRSRLFSVVTMMLPVTFYCARVSAPQQNPAVMNLLFIPGAFLLIIAAAGNDKDSTKSWMHRRFWVLLGDASFALYMIHAILLKFFVLIVEGLIGGDFTRSLPLETSLILLFVLMSVVLSLAVHPYFEHPLRRQLVKLLNLSPPPF